MWGDEPTKTEEENINPEDPPARYYCLLDGFLSLFNHSLIIWSIVFW